MAVTFTDPFLMRIICTLVHFNNPHLTAKGVQFKDGKAWQIMHSPTQPATRGHYCGVGWGGGEADVVVILQETCNDLSPLWNEGFACVTGRNVINPSTIGFN